jgi:hypothetical protein
MANKVNRVILFFAAYVIVDLDPLLSSLPNLHTLFSTEHDELVDISSDQNTLFPFFDHIQHLSEDYSNGITHKMLQSQSYLNLTCLRIFDFDHTMLPLLKNTPNVVSLSLSTFISSFETLDDLHQNLPHLQNLHLKTIDMSNTNLKTIGVVPVTTLTECVFDKVKTANGTALMNILKYMTMKYSSLVKLKFWTSSRIRLTDNDIVNLIQSGWDPLFKKLGRQLETLGLSGRAFEQQINLLDASGCRIKHMTTNCKVGTILSRLAASNQTEYIQTLVLHTINSDSLHALNEFRTLVKLKLDDNFTHSKDYAFHLPDILKYAPPTLKYLSISRSMVAVDSNYEHVSYSIEKVSFSSTTLPNGIDVFLSRCIPNLSYLKLNYCGMLGKTLDLAKLNLYKFCFIDYFFFGGNAVNRIIKVLTLRNNGGRLYEVGNPEDIDFIDKHLRSLYAPFKTWPVEGADTEPEFTLICNSLKNIAFHQSLILLLFNNKMKRFYCFFMLLKLFISLTFATFDIKYNERHVLDTKATLTR